MGRKKKILFDESEEDIKTCGTCKHFENCKKISGSKETDIACLVYGEK